MNENTCEGGLVSVETIKASPLGEELTDEQCALLSEVVGACGLQDGKFLIEEGKQDDTIYVVVKGRLEAVVRTGGGAMLTLQVLKPGDMVGELGFIDGVEHSAGLRALGECELLTLHRENFEGLLERDPQLVYKVMRSIMRTVHRILRHMNCQYVELSNYISRQHGRY